MSKQDESLTHVHKSQEPEPALCPHGYPEGRGCEECEFWERVDYEYDRYRDEGRHYVHDEPAHRL